MRRKILQSERSALARQSRNYPRERSHNSESDKNSLCCGHNVTMPFSEGYGNILCLGRKTDILGICGFGWN